MTRKAKFGGEVGGEGLAVDLVVGGGVGGEGGDLEGEGLGHLAEALVVHETPAGGGKPDGALDKGGIQGADTGGGVGGGGGGGEGEGDREKESEDYR